MIKKYAFYLHLVSVSSSKACEVEQWHVNFRNECITGLETPAGIRANEMIKEFNLDLLANNSSYLSGSDLQ